MNYRIRLFQDNLIDVVNQFDDIPMEVRRAIIENVSNLVEKKANDLIMQEREQEAVNEQSILQDKLGELPE